MGARDVRSCAPHDATPILIPQSCRKFATLPTVFVISLVLITHVIFLLRTYALYGKSRTILAVLIPCWIIEAGVLIWTAFDERLTFLPKGFGCVPASPRRIQGVVTWTAPFIYDCMICVFTLRKSLQYRRDNNDVAIVQIVLRDGLVYFAVMFTCYFVNIFIYLLAPEGLQDINAGFSTSITVIMTCRLILNLRAARPGDLTATADFPSRSRVSFLSKPSDLLTTFLTEIGRDLESGVDRRHRAHDYQLQDIQDGPLSRRRGTPYIV